MTNKIVFISDFFLNEVAGGAEYCNEALIGLLQGRYEVERKKSLHVTESFVAENQESFFIVANFFQLAELTKSAMASTRYVILEHDHKYIKSNNPILFVNFEAPESQIQNKEFYRNAITTICQSKMHAEILQKNLYLNNITNFGGNIWTDSQLAVLQKHVNNEKTIEYGIIRSQNRNKGMPYAVEFCRQNGLSFEFLEEQKFEDFIENLSRVKSLIFFPQWFESYSRLAIEAKILGCKLITNSLLGASSESYFKQKGLELLQTIRENNTTILDRWLSLINGTGVTYIPPLRMPKVSIIVPLYKGERYIEEFLRDMENQTIFDNCELIIINADSPEDEEKHITEFMSRHANVIYRKLDYVATVMETENMAIKMATGEFIAQACVDDRHAPDSFEVLSKHLALNEEVDLVYGDCYQTTQPNETFNENTSHGALYEHSQLEYSPENMVKCLPGPMPMWRKSMHESAGYFREELAHAGDWDLFLRAIDTGSVFKKVDRPIGLYYLNEEGLSTSTEKFETKIKEECEVFEAYKHIFGEANYNTFKGYFHQFDEEKDGT